MLNTIDVLPDGFLDCAATDLHRLFPGPTLVHLPGRREPPLFVSILLHGNEATGLDAIQALLRRHAPWGGPQPLPRGVSLLIGNVAAAARGLRRMPGQPDFNRVWPGGEAPDSPEAQAMSEAVAAMRERGVFASIDLHNNTGMNPHYACVNRLDNRFLQLATLFSRTVVYFLRPLGVQSMAFAPLCPAVTLECGQVGQLRGTDHALQFLDAALRLAELPDHPVPVHDLDVFHTVAVVRIPEGVRFGFGPQPGGLELVAGLDHLNFRELPAGTQLGTVDGNAGCRLVAQAEDGREVTGDYFRIDEGRLVTRVPLMPSMLTLDAEVIRQDCLCYLMERIDPRQAG